MAPLVVVDCAKGTGRCNLAFGAVGMIAAISATISTTAVGYLAQAWGKFWGFAIMAVAGLLALWLLLPETVGMAREGAG